MGLLTERAILVTGAAGGIGSATAELLARLGANLYLNDVGCGLDGTGRDASRVAELAINLSAHGGRVERDASNLSEGGAPAALVRAAVEAFGRLDGVVHCAGVRIERGVAKVGDEDLARAVDAPVRMAFGLTAAAAETMIAAKARGSIVHCVSPTAFFGSARSSLDAASSGAVVGMVRSAAVELRRHGIRINAVAPTARTRITEDTALFRGIAEGSMLPEHVAPLIAFLVSERGAQVNGESLGAAGGRLYAFQSRETTGAFMEGRGFDVDEILETWDAVVRG